MSFQKDTERIIRRRRISHRLPGGLTMRQCQIAKDDSGECYGILWPRLVMFNEEKRSTTNNEVAIYHPVRPAAGMTVTKYDICWLMSYGSVPVAVEEVCRGSDCANPECVPVQVLRELSVLRHRICGPAYSVQPADGMCIRSRWEFAAEHSLKMIVSDAGILRRLRTSASNKTGALPQPQTPHIAAGNLRQIDRNSTMAAATILVEIHNAFWKQGNAARCRGSQTQDDRLFEVNQVSTRLEEDGNRIDKSRLLAKRPVLRDIVGQSLGEAS